MQTKIRLLLLLMVVLIIGENLLTYYYDPSISPLVTEVTKEGFTPILSSKLLTLVFGLYMLEEICLFIYSFFALWVGHRSGKWAFLVVNILGIFDFVFLKVQIYSWASMGVQTLLLIVQGMLLVLVFCPSNLEHKTSTSV